MISIFLILFNFIGTKDEIFIPFAKVDTMNSHNFSIHQKCFEKWSKSKKFVPIYLGILALTIVIDYFAGILLEQHEGRTKKWILALSIVANVGVLAVFKYYQFIFNNISWLAHVLDIPVQIPVLSLLLPIGLSFHTFQAMSYTIEVYRGNQKAERNFGIYSLYVMFYPQLVAGPIERPQNLIHQFYEPKHWDRHRVQSGLLQMVIGIFKKVVIADRLSMVVDEVYGNIGEQSGTNLVVAAIFYSFQIYCDFSGYSDVAIGAARVMGFRLMENFNAPYWATSIPEFWRRWHISLSTWFKDYLYITLGGNRVSVPRWYLNIMIIFVLSGLWHGASWNFVIWGALHGLFQLIGLILNRLFPFLAADQRKTWAGIWAYRLLTFFLVTLAWVFFRISNFSTIKLWFSRMALMDFSSPLQVSMVTNEVYVSIFLILGLFALEYRRDMVKARLEQFFWLTFPMLVLITYFLGVFNMKQFIYFQF